MHSALRAPLSILTYHSTHGGSSAQKSLHLQKLQFRNKLHFTDSYMEDLMGENMIRKICASSSLSLSGNTQVSSAGIEEVGRSRYICQVKKGGGRIARKGRGIQPARGGYREHTIYMVYTNPPPSPLPSTQPGLTPSPAQPAAPRKKGGTKYWICRCYMR